MELKSEAPGVLVARAGADETICTASKSSGFGQDTTPELGRGASGWTVTFRIRAKANPRRWGYCVSITNGVTFVSFWGHATTGNRLYAQLEAELGGALTALDWLRHLDPRTPGEIRFSATGFSVFMGEAPCPHVLKPLLERARRAYITAGDAISIDRDRRALVTQEERVAA